MLDATDKYTIALVGLALFAGYAFLSATYWAWVTATPETPLGLRHAQIAFYIWISLFVSAIIASIVIVIRLIKVYRKERRS